jgi:hypothetical protein
MASSWALSFFRSFRFVAPLARGVFNPSAVTRRTKVEHQAPVNLIHRLLFGNALQLGKQVLNLLPEIPDRSSAEITGGAGSATASMVMR